MIQEIHIGLANGRDAKGENLLYEIEHTLGISTVTEVRVSKVYRLEGLSEQEALRFAEAALVDVGEAYRLNQPTHREGVQLIQIAYLPGVMNPESASIHKAALDLGFTQLTAVDSTRVYALYGAMSEAELERIITKLLMNPTVEHRVISRPETLHILGAPGIIRTIPLRTMSDEALLALSQDTLFLSLDELHTIQRYFQDQQRDPTDGELETLAQTWSEHCIHKTFRSPLLVDGQEKPSLFSRLRRASERYSRGVVSAFVDNSGVIELYDGWAICGKVETHNSPSAIEPYGGSMTGSGGVFRDIMGTGQGAKVIASTDMFCVAPPNLPDEELPPGCLHPRYLLRQVVAGVRDYGNRMGIPTCNGSIHFHPDFRAKPSVIVGAFGLLPTSYAQKRQPQPGDVVIVVGGRTGRDGIHGATFSSAAMTARTGQVNASAVQIGNAIEEERVFEALLLCRDAGLVRAITDCGAGGLSSAIGEMGSQTGVQVYLDRAPLKYKGLAPWEIWLSESQERMVVAVAPESVEQFAHSCHRYNVEVTELGVFTDTHRLRVDYHDQVLCDLDMAFLHDGVPIRRLSAIRQQTSEATSAEGVAQPPTSSHEWQDLLEQILAHGDVCSKEPIVRLYDHSVQGSSVLPPFAGVLHDGPSDAAVLAPVLGKRYGIVIAHGLHPLLTRLDPYQGALWSATEAVANACAAGAKAADLALIDNFIWPAPTEEWLWTLDQAIEACVAFMEQMHIPFISGKDSLSSTYHWPDGTSLHIPPVLCVSAFGRIPDITQTFSADLKHAGSSLILLGQPDSAHLGGTVYAQVAGKRLSRNQKRMGPQVEVASLPATLDALHAAMQTGDVLSCHDISQGGLAAALAEMAFGGCLGIEVDLDVCGATAPDAFLLSETAGCFVLETNRPNQILAQCRGVPAVVIGKTLAEFRLTASNSTGPVFGISLARLKQVWQQPMQEIFH